MRIEGFTPFSWPGNLTQNELVGRITAITAVALIALVALVRYLRRPPTPPAPKEPSAVAPRSSRPKESSVVDVPHTLSGVIGHDAKKIDEAFDELSKNLSGLRGKAGEAFIAQVQKFYIDHQNNKNDPSYARAFELVQFNEKTYKALLEMRGAIFFAKTFSHDDNTVPVPSDGNCLFHALGIGLTFYEQILRSDGIWNFPVDHLSIREEVTKWIIHNLDHDQALRQHLENAIVEFLPILDEQQERDRLTIETERGISDVAALVRSYGEKAEQIQVLRTGDVQARYLAYIEMTRHEGKFASSPQIYAFCKLNPAICVQISRRIQMPARNGAQPYVIRSKDYDLPYNPEGRFVIDLAYSINGDHFDLVLPGSH